MTTGIDLSQLPAPDVVETLDYESILSDMKTDLQERMGPDAFDALVESDPAIKVLEVAAYRELLLRARVNKAARSVMLAYATGADLDNVAAHARVTRLDGETDERLRKRAALAPEGYSTAGPEGAYRFHALKASNEVKSVSIESDTPGVVTVTVLSSIDAGVPTTELIALVDAALSSDNVRPLTDSVIVEPAAIVNYTIEAELEIETGPDQTFVTSAALAAVTDYAAKQHVLGAKVALSGIYAALHQPGVIDVNLIAPNADIETTQAQAAYATSITVSHP